METVERDFGVSVEFINGTNSYWIPTPLDEIEELGQNGIIDIGDDQDYFEKLVSLVHEVGHVIFSNKTQLKEHRRILLFEESLAWYLGYDYALSKGVEINLTEYSERIEKALSLYSGSRFV